MMRTKNVVGLIALVAIVAAVIFAGCVEEETPVPAPSPVATPLPKTTPTPVAPTATPTAEPITLSGTGQEATSKFTLEKRLSIFRMSHDGDSNFAIWLLDDEGDNVELLVNEIGSFDGSKAVGNKKFPSPWLSLWQDHRVLRQGDAASQHRKFLYTLQGHPVASHREFSS